MITPTNARPDFVVHPSITRNAARFCLTCEGLSLLGNPRVLRNTDKWLVYETVTNTGSGWVRVRARFATDDAIVRIWAWPVFGDTSLSYPHFTSSFLELVTTHAGSDYVGRFNLGSNGSQMLHGQGLPVRARSATNRRSRS
jgi:hypothetical protein